MSCVNIFPLKLKANQIIYIVDDQRSKNGYPDLVILYTFRVVRRAGLVPAKRHKLPDYGDKKLGFSINCGNFLAIIRQARLT